MKKLGPAPTPLRPPPGLSSARQAVLRWLGTAAGPVLVVEVAAALGLHPNTAREHLDGLCAAGLVTRTRAVPSGRGRPPWTYQVSPGATSPELREYVGLVSALAEHVLRTSDQPQEDARRAGQSWGAGLVPHEQLPVRRRARRTLDLLDELGFSPSRPTAAGAVKLRTCPLLEVAQAYPDVVCAAHLGLVEGALAGLGRPADDEGRVELRAFSDPGACRLLVPVDEPGRSSPGGRP